MSFRSCDLSGFALPFTAQAQLFFFFSGPAVFLSACLHHSLSNPFLAMSLGHVGFLMLCVLVSCFFTSFYETLNTTVWRRTAVDSETNQFPIPNREAREGLSYHVSCFHEKVNFPGPHPSLQSSLPSFKVSLCTYWAGEHLPQSWPWCSMMNRLKNQRRQWKGASNPKAPEYHFQM